MITRGRVTWRRFERVPLRLQQALGAQAHRRDAGAARGIGAHRDLEQVLAVAQQRGRHAQPQRAAVRPAVVDLLELAGGRDHLAVELHAVGVADAADEQRLRLVGMARGRGEADAQLGPADGARPVGVPMQRQRDLGRRRRGAADEAHLQFAAVEREHLAGGSCRGGRQQHSHQRESGEQQAAHQPSMRPSSPMRLASNTASPRECTASLL
ncbi:hypothetical protein [Variovorax sp. UC122_21]|uniref:hypothetical protein n=1 Tax=Variovorax sp. UC122_21 TaxID=3374554 RepID=UPI0037577334